MNILTASLKRSQEIVKILNSQNTLSGLRTYFLTCPRTLTLMASTNCFICSIFLLIFFLFCFTISYFVARFRHFYISTQGIEFTFCWLTAFDFNFMTPIYKCTFFMNQFLHIEITIKRLAI